MLLQPGGQKLQNHLLGFRMHRIDRSEMLPITPIVGDVVVHRDFLPDSESEEIDGVFVPGDRLGNGDRPLFRVDGPICLGNLLARGAIKHLPPFLGIVREIHHELLPEKPLEQSHRELGFVGHEREAHEEILLKLLQIFSGPRLNRSHQADGRIDVVSGIDDLGGKLGSVTVTDRVSAPFLG